LFDACEQASRLAFNSNNSHAVEPANDRTLSAGFAARHAMFMGNGDLIVSIKSLAFNFGPDRSKWPQKHEG
jgi:hypothetical protein